MNAAEKLEAEAANERATYLAGFGILGSRVLDVGCGNGYLVLALRGRGSAAVGVDRSLYRMSRWLGDGRAGRHLVVADASALPFAAGTFDTSIASGMLEHVGVEEQSAPYRVRPLPGQRRLRAAAVGELLRVSAGAVVLDFPNGNFPIDFWHGDALGALRIHAVPDSLNPTLREVRSYLPGIRVTVLPLRNRLRFRQISHRPWGRLLAPIVRVGIRCLDRLPRNFPLLAFLYPFLVVKIAEER